MKPARNDPCPCGSNRKYKHCCGALTATASGAPVAPGAADATALARLLEEGQLREAESGLRQLLQQQPDSGALWKLLSVTLSRQGSDALAALRKAAQLLPEDAEAQRNLAAVLLDRGELLEALASLERACALAPRNVPLLLARAGCLCALRRAREALPLYEQVLQLEPRLAAAHNNMGNALQELGECARAADCYRQALAINPEDAELHANLGNALRQLGQLQEALECSERAIELAPGLALAHHNLALVHAALGRRAEAIAGFRRAIGLNSAFSHAYEQLGKVLCDAGEYAEALPILHRAAQLDPQHAELHCQLAHTQFELGHLEDSLSSFRRAVELQPAHAQARLGLATALRADGRISEAQAQCEALLAAHPEEAAGLVLLGDLYADRGAFAQAHDLYQRALKRDGGSAAALCSIAAARRMTGDDGAWLQGVQALINRPHLPLAHAIGLRYALGKYYDDLARYDEAFTAYRQANELSARHAPRYDAPALTREVQQTIATFDAGELQRSHAGASGSQLPVFVIGMPRSGTSLTEQILASHPDVYGAGELHYWDDAAAAFARATGTDAPRAETLATLAGEYLARLTARAGPARRVIDKMPGNFMYAGLIHVALPGARFIHMRRQPLDTCLSVYFQNLGARHPYAHDLAALAHYYGEYVRISEHWSALLPSQTLLEVPYEELIADPERWTRRMLEFLGLPWDARCLDFHQTERVVLTLSRWQVRQKINSGSIARWRNYQRYLAPLLPLLQLDGGAA